MLSKILKILTKVSLIFVASVFLMGYNSEKISKIFLPRVNVYMVKSEEIKTTIDFDGQLEAKNTRNVRFSYDIIIDHYLVKDGEMVVEGDPIFVIKDLLMINSIKEERDNLELELNRLLYSYDQLTSDMNSLKFRRIEIIRDNIKVLKDDLEKFNVLLKMDLTYQDEVDKLKRDIESKNIELDSYLVNYSEVEKNQGLEILDLLGKIRIVEEKLDNLEIKRAFYEDIDEDGVYRACISGIVTGLVNSDQVVQKNTVVLNINEINDYNSYYYHGSFDKKNENLIQKDDLVYLTVSENVKSIKCRITKVYEIVDDRISVDADIIEESGFLLLGAEYPARAIEYPSSLVNVPRSSIVSRNEIKIGSRVEFYVINKIEGVLGDEYQCMLGYGTAAYVGDDMIGLSEKTLPQVTEIVIVNPSMKIKSGDKVSW